MNLSTQLRLILLLAAAVIWLGIYLFGKRKAAAGHAAAQVMGRNSDAYGTEARSDASYDLDDAELRSSHAAAVFEPVEPLDEETLETPAYMRRQGQREVRQDYEPRIADADDYEDLDDVPQFNERFVGQTDSEFAARSTAVTVKSAAARYTAQSEPDDMHAEPVSMTAAQADVPHYEETGYDEPRYAEAGYAETGFDEPVYAQPVRDSFHVSAPDAAHDAALTDAGFIDRVSEYASGAAMRREPVVSFDAEFAVAPEAAPRVASVRATPDEIDDFAATHVDVGSMPVTVQSPVSEVAVVAVRDIEPEPPTIPVVQEPVSSTQPFVPAATASVSTAAVAPTLSEAVPRQSVAGHESARTVSEPVVLSARADTIASVTTASTSVSALANTPAPAPAKPAASAAARRKIIALRLPMPERVPGAQLLQLLQNERLQHGKFSIFHRMHEAATVFSVASMVEPGTFDPGVMAEQQFPGVTLFMLLPGPLDGLVAYDQMLSCAQRLAHATGGTLQDERGSKLTAHLVERLREEVLDFQHLLGSVATAQ